MFVNRSHVRYEFTNTKKLVKKLARIETSSICRQQFANVFADCVCAFHTHQLEFANKSLPCEGRFNQWSAEQDASRISSNDLCTFFAGPEVALNYTNLACVKRSLEIFFRVLGAREIFYLPFRDVLMS